MSTVISPVILDRTGVRIAEGIQSIAAALWSEKAPIIQRKDVNLYDFDGTRVYSYSKAEFLGLSSLPGNPAHDGLTAQGWNWSLADAQAYVQKYGVLDIGQTYITDDGKTRLYVEIGYTENLTITLKFNQSAAEGVTVDWGDGVIEVAATSGDVAMTHTYADEGKYIVTLDVSDGCSVRLGTSTGSGASILAVGISKSFFSQGDRGITSGKDALVALEIGAGVTDIGSSAFAYMTSLKYITIPNTVTTIRDIVFYACINLETIVIPSGIPRVGNLQHGFNYALKACSLPASATAIGQSAFKTCTNLNRICIPEGVTSLANYTCYGLQTAKEIIIPDTVAGAIPHYGFSHCYRIEKINIPAGITSIGDYAFSNDYNLRGVELPEGLTTIGKNAFQSCFAFFEFVIPSTVTSIAAFAFLYSDGAASFKVRATTPPALEPTAFQAAFGDLNIYVPYSADHSILEAYKTATGWCSKADHIFEEVGESA